MAAWIGYKHMTICFTCIKKDQKDFPFIEAIPLKNNHCDKCDLTTLQISYECFRDKLFEVIEKNYVKLDKLPSMEMRYFFLHREDDVTQILKIIESLDLEDRLSERLSNDIPNEDNYVLNHYTLDEYVEGEMESRWTSIEDKFKYKNRFFNDDLIKLLNRAFKYISTKKIINSDVIHTFKADDELYRGRSFNSISELMDNIPVENINIESTEYKAALVKKFGIVPKELASNQRMTPEGISCLYLSTGVDACLSEIRAAVGQYVGVICLKSKRDLRLLDFNLLEKGMNAHHLDENYIEKIDVFSFFRSLITKVSMPKLNESNSSYLISQFFFEYLRVIFGDQLDGILLKSVQQPDSNNIILFPELTEKGIGIDKDSPQEQPIYFYWPTLGFGYDNQLRGGVELGSESELGVDISKVSSIQISRIRYQHYDHCENKEFDGYIV